MSSTMSSVPSSPSLNGPSSATTDSDKQSTSISGLTHSPTSTISNNSSPSTPAPISRRVPSGGMSFFENNAPRNIASTSNVIESLQQTIDTLRRELKEKSARATEEKQGRDAIKKRCDKIESQLEGLKHQNETLNSIIGRKERRMKELEKEIESKAKHVSNLEKDQQEFLQSKNEYDTVMNQVKGEKERSDASYQAVVVGAKATKAAYEEKFKEIAEKVKHLIEDRANDKEQIDLLKKVISEQKAEREKIEKLKKEMTEQRQEYTQHITKLFDKFNLQLTEKDTEVNKKFKETMALVNNLKRRQNEISK